MYGRTANRKSVAAIAILMAATLFSVSSCRKKDKPETISAVTDRAAMASLEETDVVTVISDSGITRYRLSAPHWLIYDEAQPPYWEFPQGVVLERFDPSLHVDASVRSDYAKYHQQEQVWELDGDVEAVNLDGEVFETQQLFWDQKNERVYSDSLIRITRSSSIIVGMGFQSNQTFSKYTILNPQGVFPIRDDEDEVERESGESGQSGQSEGSTDLTD